jgi:hypothetical protein
MIRGIDHLVIACSDPDAAATRLESALGLVATGGGRHEGFGTFNRIVWLADGSYLELVGVADRDAARTTPVSAAVLRVLDELDGGLATYALRDDDVELTVGALQGAGSALGPVTRGTRRNPDGEEVEWWASVPQEPLGPDALPFLIQHAYTGAEWSHDAVVARGAFEHPIGSPVIMVRLDLASVDPPALAARYHTGLGLEFWAVGDLAVCTIGRHTIRLVRARDMEVPAAVTLGAAVEGPRSAAELGMRFDVEWVELPLPAPNRA